MFDDTKMIEMLELWRQLPLPKFDVTSLAHWSGTGLAIVPSADHVPESRGPASRP